jgi:hypothetical protein
MPQPTLGLFNEASGVPRPIQGVAILDASGNAVGASDATAANQVLTNTKLDTLHTDLIASATAANQTTMNTKLDTLHADIGTTIHADLIAPTPAGTNIIGKVGVDQTTFGTTNGVAVRVSASQGVPGVIDSTDGYSSTGAADALKVAGFGRVYNGASWDRYNKPNLTSRIVTSGASTNATSVKAGAGDLYRVIATNTTASPKYLKFYNKASAPTVGTDTPILTICLDASKTLTFDFGAHGQYFSTGIAFAITGAPADSDTTVLASSDVTCLNVCYR